VFQLRSNVFALGDIYLANNTLAARWRPNASWMANQAVINAFRQLPVGSGLQQSIVDDSGEVPRILGRPVYENSNMDGTLNAAASDLALVFGDFNQYAIVDRIGTSIEVVPHLFGAAGRPMAQRGFYQHWRVGADALVTGAFVTSSRPRGWRQRSPGSNRVAVWPANRPGMRVFLEQLVLAGEDLGD
jgi:HK97 family phage major capsid protein